MRVGGGRKQGELPPVVLLDPAWHGHHAGQAEPAGSAHVTGPYRTLAQDVSFGVDQLVEIAIRALSPAVNDTFTALTCIDWIGDSLCKVTGRWLPIRFYRDGNTDRIAILAALAAPVAAAAILLPFRASWSTRTRRCCWSWWSLR